MVVGCLVGAVSGYFGGIVDDVIGRIVDVFMSIPEIVLNIAMVGVFCALYGTSTFIVIFAVVFTNWVSYARLMRGMVLSLREGVRCMCQSHRCWGVVHTLQARNPKCCAATNSSRNSEHRERDNDDCEPRLSGLGHSTANSGMGTDT